MTGACVVLSDGRCARAAALPHAGHAGHAGRARPPDRLAGLLALSLLLHLALLAWPLAGNDTVGQGPSTTTGIRLDAALAAHPLIHDAPPGPSGKAHLQTRRRGAAQTPLLPTVPAAVADAAKVASPSPAAAPEPPAAPALHLPFPPLPPTHYYPADQLTARPRALDEPDLDPPPLASVVASGEIAFSLWIDEHGQVTELRVEHNDLPEAFAQTAATAFKELRFAPGEIDGRAVGSVLRIAVRYDDERAGGGRDVARSPAIDPST